MIKISYMFIYDNLYSTLIQFGLVSLKLHTVRTIFTTRWPFRAVIIWTSKQNENKNSKKARNVLLIISQRETYSKSNQATPSIWIFLFATEMEDTVYFAAGLCFHLYLLPKWTKGFDVTVQLPFMTTDKNCSNFT